MPPYESDEDLDAFFDPDDGAVLAHWTVDATDAVVDLYGWHNRPVRQLAGDASVDVYSGTPSFLCSSRRAPSAGAEGDLITVETDDGDLDYRVKGLRPDGNGVIRVDLDAV